MITAIVLVNVERPKIKTVIDSLMRLQGVSEVHTVAGEYDLAVIVRVQNSQELSSIVVDKMPHQTDGVTHTKTLVALASQSKVDLEKVFLSLQA